MHSTSPPQFWRDPDMPYIELRRVADGRSVCYAPHTHTQWSIGAITAGQSTFVSGARRYVVQAGTLVLINPDRVHACNPINGQSWSYLMMYVDPGWLARRCHQLGLWPSADWRDIASDLLQQQALFDQFCSLAGTLLSVHGTLTARQAALDTYFGRLLPAILGSSGCAAARSAAVPDALKTVIGRLDTDCAQPMSLSQMSELAGCTPSQLIRLFRQHTGLTPHAYMINRRVQLAQHALKRGSSIVDAALAAGFADQAHLQRIFKRTLAATPGQYRDAQPKTSIAQLPASKAASS